MARQLDFHSFHTWDLIDFDQTPQPFKKNSIYVCIFGSKPLGRFIPSVNKY